MRKLQMDSDEELFDATPSCSISTNTSLNLTQQAKDLTLDSTQERDSNNVTTKNISVKLTRLPDAKTEEEQTNLHLAKKKRRYLWKFGQVSTKGRFEKNEKRKKVSFIPSRSLQFQKMEPTTEDISILSKDRENEENTQVTESYDVEVLSEGDQEGEQDAQSETKSFISSTSQAQKEVEEEEDSYAAKTFVCARTLPYEFHRKSGKIFDDGTIVKSTTPSFLLDGNTTPSSNSKNTEPSLHSNRSYLSECSSSNSANATKRLIHSKLKFMAKRVKGKQLDEWKFKRKYTSSDSEIEEIPLQKKCRRILSNESDSEDSSVSNAEAIDNNNKDNKDNNRSKSHLSLEKIDKKETDIQIKSARVILTRLEEMEDEDVIKWRERKTKPLDITAFEPVEEQQLDRLELVRNLVTLESRDKLILPKEDGLLETKEPPISKDSPLSRNVERRLALKLRWNKLRKKYKLFRKPRVLMIDLDTLCSSKDGRYSATEVDRLTKKYVTFVINSNNQHKTRRSKTYRPAHLQKRSTQRIPIDAENTAEDHNTSPTLSRRQSTNEIFKSRFTEKSSIKDVQTIQNSDENVPFKTHRKFIQNQSKSSSSGTSEKSGPSSQKRLEIWRNAFRVLMTSEKPQKKTTSTQSTSTSQTPPISRNSPEKSVVARCESVFTLPSTSTSSPKHSTLVGSPRKLASPKKQTKPSAKPTKCNTSKSESSVSSKNLPNVEKNISNSDFTQSKAKTVSKSPCKNAKEIDVAISDAFLNSSKKISNTTRKSHQKAIKLESRLLKDMSIKSKISKMRGVERSLRRRGQTYKCTVCNELFENQEELVKHMLITNFHNTCRPGWAFSNASKSEEASMLDKTVVNKNSQNLEKSKPSTSQEQCSSVNGEGSSHQSAKSIVDSDMEISSSSSTLSSRVVKTHHERSKMPHKKTKAKSTTKSKSNLKLDSSNRAKSLESKNVKLNRTRNSRIRRKCTICLQVFDTSYQLFRHTFKHMAHDLKSMYTTIKKIKIATSQESNENNDQVDDVGANATSQESIENNDQVDDIGENSVEAVMEEVEVAKNGVNGQEKKSENTNKSSAENPVASRVTQPDATKGRSDASNVSAANTVERDSQRQSTPIANNVEQNVQIAEKERTCVAESSSEQSTKSFTICGCHRPKTSNESPVQIEIVLLCTICQTLFRRFECFEAHCAQRSAEGTLCNKNRRNGRKSTLLCVNCQQTLNSVQELGIHLVMHSRLYRASTATFWCNICRVIFHGLGQLFTNHFQNHAKNPFFLASRLSFPRPSFIGSKLIKFRSTDNDNDQLTEFYMQIADHVCQDCRTPFMTLQALKSHKMICPNATTTSADPRSGSSNSITSAKMPVLLICGFCNKTFYSRMSFEVHSLEHTQKRDVHLHYTCVAVTAVTKVYICKVCTTMWQSLQSFEEHWQTHAALQEDYICSRCRNHYNSIDLFQRHAIVHRSTNEMQQMPITCEVIYRDTSNLNSTNPQKDAAGDDLPYMDLSCFNNDLNVEKTVNGKSREIEELTQSVLEKILFGNRPAQEAVISPELSVGSNKELQATKNASQVPVQVPSPNVAVTQSRRSNNSNLRNFDDDSDEEEDLTIVLSESEESSVSRNIDSTPSTKHQNMQENAKSTSNSAVTDEQIQCSNDADSAVASTSNDVSISANSNARHSVITPGESANTQLNTNVSNSKDDKISDANKTLENCVNHSDANSSKELLPKNAMSSVPKSFLRVKSLAELTNNQFCRLCGMSFESRHKLRGHVTACTHIHNMQLARQGKQDGQTSSSDNAQARPAKPINPVVSVPTTSTQDCPVPSVASTANVPPSISVRLSTPTRVIDTANSRQYQVIGVKPLHSVKFNTIADVSKPKETLPREVTRPLNNVSATPHSSQKTAYHQNLPAHVSHPLKKSTQLTQQQQNTGTVAIKPFLQTTYQTPRPPPPPPYSQQQQPQQLQQQSQHFQQLLQVQQQPQLQQQPQQQQFQKQLQQSQLQQLQQLQQQQQQPQQLQQQQQLRQQLQQHLQQQSQQLQQMQQQQQLQMQLQMQQQQQQQMNIGNNVMQYVISKAGQSYQLSPSNMIPTSSDNVMLVPVNTMQQTSENPDRYVCLYCPGFECGSVQEFALHEHSPKHEARSHYNGIAYVPRT
ncbi:uncharacterized protein [Temnothorax nylanderi]|uniref:uncharacterized protein isoform X2 n=1 Tax=Temnothorax nylanderi TaxID=102681 RepID=UPI003A8B29F0